MKKIKLIFIWICLEINIRLVFNIDYIIKKDGIDIDFKLRDWCKNAI